MSAKSNYKLGQQVLFVGITSWEFMTTFARTLSGTDNKGVLIPYIFIITVFTGNVTQFWKITEF